MQQLAPCSFHSRNYDASVDISDEAHGLAQLARVCAYVQADGNKPTPGIDMLGAATAEHPTPPSRAGLGLPSRATAVRPHSTAQVSLTTGLRARLGGLLIRTMYLRGRSSWLNAAQVNTWRAGVS